MLPSEENESSDLAYRVHRLDGLPLFEFILTALLTLAAFALFKWFGSDGIRLAFRYAFRFAVVIPMMLVVMFAWSCVYVCAPEATKYATVLLVICGVMFSLIPCWIL